jgi:hypothetical protein
MSEVESDRDLQYLMQMYPKDAKLLQKKVEQACDRLEYEGSMLYDEYPDRISMLMICDRIAGEVMAQEAQDGPVGVMEPARRSLLEVLLYHEMHRRRCERRSNRRFW